MDTVPLVPPTANTVLVSYQSNSNLVDWVTVTNQIFVGAPSVRLVRVAAEAPAISKP